jgi:hypothetical protein
VVRGHPIGLGRSGERLAVSVAADGWRRPAGGPCGAARAAERLGVGKRTEAGRRTDVVD